MAVSTDLTIFAEFKVRNADGCADVIDARMVVVRDGFGAAVATAFGVCDNGQPACDAVGSVLAPANALEAVAMAADRAGWGLVPAAD